LRGGYLDSQRVVFDAIEESSGVLKDTVEESAIVKLVKFEKPAMVLGGNSLREFLSVFQSPASLNPGLPIIVAIFQEKSRRLVALDAGVQMELRTLVRIIHLPSFTVAPEIDDSQPEPGYSYQYP
jgi:hypothetical protein